MPLLLLALAAASTAAASPHPPLTATASPSRLSIELGGDVVVVADGPPPADGAATCYLTRLYGSGGYGLTRDKLGPSFKHCCNLTVPATRLNATAVTCHVPAGAVATEGNTTFTTSVGFGYVRHYASFVPEFARRPFVHEADGAVLVRLAQNLQARAPTLHVSIPCGGPKLEVNLEGQASTALSPYAQFRVSFPLGAVSSPCYEATVISLSLDGAVTIVRNRTFIRAPAPKRNEQKATSASSWQVDHESRSLLVDGRRFLAQGWFAGGYVVLLLLLLLLFLVLILLLTGTRTSRLGCRR